MRKLIFLSMILLFVGCSGKVNIITNPNLDGTLNVNNTETVSTPTPSSSGREVAGSNTANTVIDNLGLVDNAFAATDNVPVMSTPTIPDGIYKLVQIKKYRGNATYNFSVTGNLQIQFAYKGGGVFNRIFTGSGQAVIHSLYNESVVETFDYTDKVEGSNVKLDINGKVIDYFLDQVYGWVGGHDSKPYETVYLVEIAGHYNEGTYYDGIIVTQRAKFNDGSSIDYFYKNDFFKTNYAEIDQFIEDQILSKEKFLGSILSH